ncbi:MAG: CvfB family protein [Cellulosilyticaceae bacterium]
MIELGKIQKLTIVRQSDFGVYVNAKDGAAGEEILLPRKQVPEGAEIGHEVEVFVHRDSEDRMIATIEKPKVTVGEVAQLEVVALARIGAFLDWGLQKDLFLPFKEQTATLKVGDKCLVGVYVDKSDRLCATMKAYDILESQTPYSQNQKVEGIIYQIKDSMGALVAVGGKYHGLIPHKELAFGTYQVGDKVEARVKRIKEDGKLELSLRKQAFQQMEDDATKIMKKLEASGGKLALHDKSTPQEIKAVLNMSKASFKRAVGRLLKEGAIEQTDGGITRRW